MKSFNPGLLTHAFKQLTFYEQKVSREGPPNEVTDEFKGDVQLKPRIALPIALGILSSLQSCWIGRCEPAMRTSAIRGRHRFPGGRRRPRPAARR